jgi:rhodanese-related sulfurtransferase
MSSPTPEEGISRIDSVLEYARRLLPYRPSAEDLPALRASGALIVDIRPIEQRSRDGALPGSIVIDRNVLEWRLDPTSPYRIAEATGPDQQIVIVCNEGYASSLAALSLQQLGLLKATDLVGGVQAVLKGSRQGCLG